MKFLSVGVPAIFAGLLFLGSAPSEDKEAIIRATHDHFDSLNEGDVDKHVAFHAEQRSYFGLDGGLLKSYPTRDAQRAYLAQFVKDGFESDQEPRRIEVEIYGDAAVVTCYVTGVVKIPEARAVPISERRTVVLIKQKGKWKEVHQHSSRLETGLGAK